MELAHLIDIPLGFYFVVNKLIKDKIENIFSLITEDPGFIKYSLNKLN